MRNTVFGLCLILTVIMGAMVMGTSRACAGDDRFEQILDAIERVESSGRGKNTPDGDGGKAIGPFQIHLA